jgi:type II secretory pathway component PulF
VKTGSTISGVAPANRLLRDALRMAAMGEMTGNLDKALDTVSGYYNDVIPGN